MPRIYFDHNATTKPYPEVIEAQRETASFYFGNPSSLHHEGRMAKNRMEIARKQVASLIGARPEEIVFTSGATESNNTILMGWIERQKHLRLVDHQIISSPLEHPSVKVPLQWLAAQGISVYTLSVNRQGQLDLGELEQVLSKKKPALVTLAFCNHEIGNIYPIEKIAHLCHQYGALFHCDATQAVGRISVDVSTLPIDFMSFSSHKIHGPKGVGALFCRSFRSGEMIDSLLLGGEQEKGRRAGTEHVSGIVGFGKACEIAERELPARISRIKTLRDRLEKGVLEIPFSRIHGDPLHRVPGTCNVAFSGVSAEIMMMSLDLKGIAVSTGAACSSGSLEPSPVLLALGYSKEEALEGLRFSLGYENTEQEVDFVISCTKEIVERVRSIEPIGH